MHVVIESHDTYDDFYDLGIDDEEDEDEEEYDERMTEDEY